MPRGAPAILAAVAAGVLTAAGAGCTHTTAVLPYPREQVWQAALAETVIWRPRIDEDDFTIASRRIGLGEEEVEYELKLRAEPSLPSRPKTRVYVRIRQTKPKTERFVQEEKYFLMKLQATLEQMGKTGM